jgi:predicted alpha/beta-fold hydrolase
MLRKKLIEKSNLYPELKRINPQTIKDLKQFDDQVTAPWPLYRCRGLLVQSSCIRELEQITIPTLIINAADDPILGPECYPYQEARRNEFIHLEVPARGGHVGFMHRPNQMEYWHETKTVEFLTQINK